MSKPSLEIKFRRSFSLLFFLFAIFFLVIGIGFILEQRAFDLWIPLGIGIAIGYLYLIYLIPAATSYFKEFSTAIEGRFKKLLIYYLYLFICASPYLAVFIPIFFTGLIPDFNGANLMLAFFGFMIAIMIIFGIQIIKESKK